MQPELDIVPQDSTSHLLRSWLQIADSKPDLPSSLPVVQVSHPANDIGFLILATYDHLPAAQGVQPTVLMNRRQNGNRFLGIHTKEWSHSPKYQEDVPGGHQGDGRVAP